MNFIEAVSPNFNERKVPPDIIVLHYTGMKTGEEALAWLCNEESKVSSHYLVEEDGRVFRLVPEERRAWHAGVSSWKGETDINACSIGVEIVNPGHEFGYRAFPDAQIETVIRLLDDIRGRWSIENARILGHSDVAPARKEDPGELFPWRRLAEHGHEGLAQHDFAELVQRRSNGRGALGGAHGVELVPERRQRDVVPDGRVDGAAEGVVGEDAGQIDQRVGLAAGLSGPGQ